jgi:hypothetical protein
MAYAPVVGIRLDGLFEKDGLGKRQQHPLKSNQSLKRTHYILLIPLKFVEPKTA